MKADFTRARLVVTMINAVMIEAVKLKKRDGDALNRRVQKNSWRVKTSSRGEITESPAGPIDRTRAQVRSMRDKSPTVKCNPAQSTRELLQIRYRLPVRHSPQSIEESSPASKIATAELAFDESV